MTKLNKDREETALSKTMSSTSYGRNPWKLNKTMIQVRSGKRLRQSIQLKTIDARQKAKIVEV